MAKPNAIRWLESQTGESIPYPSPDAEPAGRERHLSVRLDRDLAAALEKIATERGSTVSQFVRELLADAVSQHQDTASLDARALVDRLAADVAEVRRRLAG